MERVARHLHRRVPESVQNRRELVTKVFVCRTRRTATAGWLEGGFGESDEEVVVLLALEKWDVNNGLFCTGQVNAGQDICLSGSEPVQFPGTGGCLVVVFFMNMPFVGTVG